MRSGTDWGYRSLGWPCRRIQPWYTLPTPGAQDADPEQYTFVSTSLGDEYQIFPNRQGNILGRGTEIVLNIDRWDRWWRKMDTVEVRDCDRPTKRIVVRCRHCGAVNSAPVGADPLTCSKTADLTGAYYRIS